MTARHRRPPAGSTGGELLRSLPPIEREDARVLLLGSMPGAASLAARRYYAHPQNAFWPIVAALVGVDPGLDYDARCARLRCAGVAVWDVLASCVRPGSLDADIELASVAVNDFAAFFAAHPHLRAVGCNGGTAFTTYRRRVLPTLAGVAAALPVFALPSTSPAHAGMSRATKAQRWRELLSPWLGADGR